jgi:hypothetical protein
LIRSAPVRLLLLTLVALCAPAAAVAQEPQPVQIDGTPLNVWTDQAGSIQASVDGFVAGEWHFAGPITDPITGNQGPNPSPNSGFALLLYRDGGDTLYHSNHGTRPTLEQGPFIQSSGDSHSVFTIWTIPDAQDVPLLRVAQVLTYTNGSRQFEMTWAVQNVSEATPAQFRAGYLGDLSVRGSDSGVGFSETGPPRFIGGVNPSVGAAGGLVEFTPWSAFQVSRYSSASSEFSGDGLDNTILTEDTDNDMAVQWSTHEPPNPALQPGETAVFQAGQRFVDTLGLTPVRATAQTGDEHTVSVKAAAVNGTPQDNTRLRWEVTGANPGEGALMTDNEGTGRLSWIGGAPGDDVLVVYRDANGNQDPDFDETKAEASVTWEGPQEPIIGQTFNVREESGNVRIQLPRGTSLARAKSLGFPPAALNRFVPLSEALSVPFGSTLDTRRGRVRLLSAGLPQRNNSSFNGASFRGALFGVRQRGSNPLTTLAMKGSLGCKRGGGSKSGLVTAARTRSIFGRGRGRFRTRGRRSSATVRGTAWLQKDSCAGTLTVVRQGTVVVKDLAKRRPIVLRSKAPKKKRRYFARAPRGR